MEMHIDASFIAVMVFVGTQIGAILWLGVSSKGDAQMVKNQLANVERELSKLANVLVTLADQQGRLNLIDDRQLAQGKRLDEFVSRLGKRVEEISLRQIRQEHE